MPRRFAAALVAASVIALVAGVAIGTVTAQEENYEGESMCAGVSAWPGGSHLSQMHPFHRDFYVRYAERRDWQACLAWSADQMRSAIRGLQAAGFTVQGPTSAIVRAHGATRCDWDGDWTASGEGSFKWVFAFGECQIDGQWIEVLATSYDAENTSEGFYVYYYDIGETPDSLGRVFVYWPN